MIERSDISLEELLVARRRMMIAYSFGFAGNWGSRLTKDFWDTPHSSPHWEILYYGMFVLYALGILVALVYAVRYFSHLRNNQEYLQLLRSKRTSRGQYQAIGASFLVTILICIAVRAISPSASIMSLIDVGLFVLCTALGIALIALKDV